MQHWHPIPIGLSKLNSPAHRYLRLRFTSTRDARRKAQGQDGVAFSFIVGLCRSQQHAGFYPGAPRITGKPSMTVR